MSHFAILVPEQGGHLIPMGSIGQELQNRGHRVTVIARDRAAEFIEKFGLSHYPLDAEFTPLRSKGVQVSMGIASLVGMGWAVGLRAMFEYRAEYLLEHVPSILQELEVDGLILDQNLLASSTIAEHCGLPCVTGCSALHWNYDPFVPPQFTGWSYSESSWARLRYALGYRFWEYYMKPAIKVINRYRKRWNLECIKRVDDAYSPLLQIAQTCGEFDYPRSRLPETFQYVGSITADRPEEESEFPWELLDGRPLIYASLGTVRPSSDVKLLRKIAIACSDLDAQLVLSTGKWSEDQDLIGEQLRDVPGNPLLMEFVPQIAMLKKADLLITHAGTNTVLEALQFGTPMVALPRGADQHAMAERIVRCGVGLKASFNHCKIEELRDLVSRVLTEESFRQRAEELQEAMIAAGGLQRAADLAEETLLANSAEVACEVS